MSKSSEVIMDCSPLNDPAYIPRAHPVNGEPPAEVERWGPKSQYRWFRHFEGQLKALPYSVWARFYCESVEHKGLCCVSCIEDRNEGYDAGADYCCCEAPRSS